MPVTRRAVLGGALSVAAAGCLGTAGYSGRTRIADALAAEPDAMDLTGTLAIDIAVDETVEEHTAHVWEADGNVRREFERDPDALGFDEFTVVSTTEETWYYRHHDVSRLPFPLRNFGLHTVDHETLRASLDDYDVTYLGRTEVAGHTAERFELTAATTSLVPEIEYYTYSISPSPPTVRPTMIDLSFDVDTGIRLREDLEVSVDDGPTARTSLSYADVDLDASVDPARFEFEPPEDARVRESRGIGLAYGTVERAELDVGYVFHGPNAFDVWELMSISPMYLEDRTQLHAAYVPEGTEIRPGMDYPRVSVAGSRDGHVVDLERLVEEVDQWTIDGTTVTYGWDGEVLRAEFAADGHAYWMTANDEVADPEGVLQLFVATAVD